MIVELQDGTRVDCRDEPLDSGAAGTIHVTRDGRSVVKFYQNPDHDLQSRLEEVVGKYNCAGTDPYWQSLFAWPDAIVVSPRLGIRMPLVKGKQKLAWITQPLAYNRLPDDAKDWHARLLIALRLARAVRRLHASGLAHGDLSPNNVFANPKDGTITVIDLDSVVVPTFLPPQVQGTPEYIAPEVLAGKASPGIEADCHALAVLLHQVLLYYHPFTRGPKIYSPDPDEDHRLSLSDQAVFIDHPTDASNRPKQYFPTRILGEEMQELFRRALVEGLRNPRVRPTAGAWEGALVRLNDRAMRCVNPRCMERTYPVTEKEGLSCPWCRTPMPLGGGIPVLRFYVSRTGQGQYAPEKDLYFVAGNGKTLHQWHATAGVLPRPGNEAPIARVEQDGVRWVLVNLALPALSVVENGAAKPPQGPGARVELRHDMQIVLSREPQGRLLYVQMVR